MSARSQAELCNNHVQGFLLVAKLNKVVIHLIISVRSNTFLNICIKDCI